MLLSYIVYRFVFDGRLTAVGRIVSACQSQLVDDTVQSTNTTTTVVVAADADATVDESCYSVASTSGARFRAIAVCIVRQIDLFINKKQNKKIENKTKSSIITIIIIIIIIFLQKK